MDIDAVKTSYARWAPIYDQTFGAITERARRTAAQYASLHTKNSLLEVGVGTGLALRYYASHLNITGVDYSEDMLERARDRIKRHGMSHIKELRQMDGRALDFPDNSFDTVVGMHMISVVPEPERVMSEMARVLRPGGRLVISNHFARSKGLMAHLSRWSARYAEQIGWHSDFDIGIVTRTHGLHVVERRALPPIGIMTLLVLEKRASASSATPAKVLSAAAS